MSVITINHSFTIDYFLLVLWTTFQFNERYMEIIKLRPEQIYKDNKYTIEMLDLQVLGTAKYYW